MKTVRIFRSRKALFFLSGAFAAAMAAGIFTGPSLRAAEAPDTEAIRKIVRDYLIDHPEVVVEALDAYQANQQEVEQRKFQNTLKESGSALMDGDYPMAGNPKGDVTVVEFFDYNCGYCKHAVADIQKVLEKDKNVKFVFREMPILSETSGTAARYALAAHKQGKYFDYYVAVMNFSGSKNEENLEKLAKDVGLDVERLRKDANSAAIRAEVDASGELARKLGIRGTPGFIIGDTLVPGYMTYDAMLKLIEKVRSDDKG